MAAVATLHEIDEKRERESSVAVEEAEKQVRVTLSKSWPRAVPLRWMSGRGSKPSTIMLQPGKSVVQPLAKCQAWFGPFAAFEEYAVCTDEKRLEKLREFIHTETARYLNSYDYPRLSNKQMEATGPHRSPDVTVTILEADGTEHSPIRLYQIYEIGEYDPMADKFATPESVDVVKARYEAQLNRVASEYKAQMTEMQKEMAQLKGLVQGVVVGEKRAKEKAE